MYIGLLLGHTSIHGGGEKVVHSAEHERGVYVRERWMGEKG